MDPDILRQILRDAIESHIEQRDLDRMYAAEERERDLMSEMIGTLPEMRPFTSRIQKARLHGIKKAKLRDR
jgi:hypothetical protein